MPRELVPTSHVDQFGVVHVKRSNGWVTSYNPAIASCIRSNHDLTWIPTSSKALAYIYYLTNYATKADISPQQILVKGALIADSIKTAGGHLANTDDLQQELEILTALVQFTRSRPRNKRCSDRQFFTSISCILYEF